MEERGLGERKKSFDDLTSKYHELVKENRLLNSKIDALKSKGITSDLQPQITALHKYNEMKDLAQFVLGYLANIEKVSLGELHQRYDLPLD